MSLPAKQISDRFRSEGLQRLEKHRHGQDYMDSGKKTVACKCPRCESYHKVFIQWAGRGMPRIFCAACRQRVNTYCEIAYEPSNPAQHKRGRRPGHLAQE